jgi:RNA recognition motif-containing protein
MADRQGDRRARTNGSTKLADSESRSEKPEQPSEPTRTLFVRNIQFQTSIDEIVSMLEQYGALKTTFDLIAKRGLAFITFVSVLRF